MHGIPPATHEIVYTTHDVLILAAAIGIMWAGLWITQWLIFGPSRHRS